MAINFARVNVYAWFCQRLIIFFILNIDKTLPCMEVPAMRANIDLQIKGSSQQIESSEFVSCIRDKSWYF